MTEQEKEKKIEDLKRQYCEDKITANQLADGVANVCEQWVSERLSK